MKNPALALAVPVVLCASPCFAQWSTEALSQPRGGCVAVAIGDRALVGGGYEILNPGVHIFHDIVDVYDTLSGTWSTAQLSQARALHAGAGTADRVLFAGGFGVQGTSDVVDIHDRATGAWSVATLSQPRWYLAGAASSTQVVFAGGEGMSGVSDVVDLYDVPSGTWLTAKLSVPRTQIAATAVGELLFFAGGWTGSSASDVVDVLDVATGQWSVMHLSVARTNLAAVSLGTRAYFAGGAAPGVGELDVVDVFDTATGVWSTEKLSLARRGLAAVAVGSSVVFAGGTKAWPQMTDVVDVFEPASGVWSTTTLAQARYQPAGVSVRNEALFCGGFTGCTLEKCSPTDLVDRLELTVGTPYCGPAVPNSSGVGARMLATGTPIAGGRLTLLARDLPPGKPGYFLTSQTTGHVTIPGSQGVLCLGGQIGRFVAAGQVLDSGAGGRFELTVDTSAMPLGASVQPGETWRFQAWFRDKNPSHTSNFTDGLAVDF